MFKRSSSLSVAALLLLMPAAGAYAAPRPAEPATLATGFAGPLHLSVGPGKTVAVSESFAGLLTAVRNGEKMVLYSSEGVDVAGSAYQGSTLYFVESVGAGPEDQRDMVGSLKAIDNKGAVRTITDELAQYEIDNNVDQDVQYGLSAAEAAANPDCVAEMEVSGLPASYTGSDVEVDSHVYGLAVRGNTAYVADAGANAVLAVDLRTGTVSTLAVLPAHVVEINEAAAEAFELPSCVGLSYGFEAVPTDIEIGPGGQVYVATLPGGPEDASLGERGKVFTIDPRSGDVSLHAWGLMTPTGIALDGAGNLYVASLFGEGIYRVPASGGEPSLFLSAMMATEVDIHGSTLYATTEAFGQGALISVKL